MKNRTREKGKWTQRKGWKGPIQEPAWQAYDMYPRDLPPVRDLLDDEACNFILLDFKAQAFILKKKNPEDKVIDPVMIVNCSSKEDSRL